MRRIYVLVREEGIYFTLEISYLKGVSIESGTIMEKNIYSDYHSTSSEYLSSNVLWICEEDDPPEFMEKRGILICSAKAHFSDEARGQAYSGSQKSSTISMGYSEGCEWRLSTGPL